MLQERHGWECRACAPGARSLVLLVSQDLGAFTPCSSLPPVRVQHGPGHVFAFCPPHPLLSPLSSPPPPVAGVGSHYIFLLHCNELWPQGKAGPWLSGLLLLSPGWRPVAARTVEGACEQGRAQCRRFPFHSCSGLLTVSKCLLAQKKGNSSNVWEEGIIS